MHSVKSTMMPVPLSLNRLMERAGQLFPESEIVSRLPDKSLRRQRYADWHWRTRALAAALGKLGHGQERPPVAQPHGAAARQWLDCAPNGASSVSFGARIDAPPPDRTDCPFSMISSIVIL